MRAFPVCRIGINRLYVVDCVAHYFLPEHARIIALASSVPQAIGEIGFGGWMLIKGIRPSTGTTSDPAPPPQLSPAR